MKKAVTSWLLLFDVLYMFSHSINDLNDVGVIDGIRDKVAIASFLDKFSLAQNPELLGDDGLGGF